MLITGETGTGKELAAGVIHTLSGLRREMVSVNLAGLDDTMFSDTLFGHVRGAFTDAVSERKGLIEQASGGTLFLDEIGDTDLRSQVKLLRLLQEGEYMPLGSDRSVKTDARIVAATNRELWDLQKKGKFREDLIHRLRIHHIHLPPLRERIGDIPLLTEHFVTEAAGELGREKPEIPAALTTLLEGYHFPGNVRELQTVIFGAVAGIPGKGSGMLRPDDIGSYIAEMREKEEASPFRKMKKLPDLKQSAEMLTDEALRRCDGNQTRAAKILGISQPSLSRRLKMRSP